MHPVPCRTLAVLAAAIAVSLYGCTPSDGDASTRDGSSEGKALTAQSKQAPAIRGIMPIRRSMLPKSAVTAGAPTGAQLAYNGGAIIENPAYVNVYWGAYWTSGTGLSERNYMNQFAQTVGTSAEFASVLDQYADKNSKKPHAGRYLGERLIAGEPGGTTKVVTDAQIRTAIDGWIQQGLVPANSPDVLYNIFFPQGVSVQMDAQNASCTAFCGYHSAVQTTRGTGGVSRYIVVPYPDCTGCQFEPAVKDSLTVVDSHEMSEAVTDPDVGIAIDTNSNNWLGWYDNTNGEIGDICAGDPNATMLGFRVQTEWSNADKACVASRNAGTGGPDFSVSASPASQSITAGNKTTYTVTVTASGGWTSDVLVTATNLGQGVVGGQAVVAGGNGSTTIVVSAYPNAPAGTSSVTFTAASGSVTHTAQVSLTVNGVSQADFSLAANPGSVTVTGGASASAQVSVAALNGFAGDVQLAASGLPAGVTASFSPAAVTGGNGNATVSFSAAASAPAGSGTVTITGTSGSIVHTATVDVSVQAAQKPDFTLALSPASGSIAQGGSAQASVTVGAANGFSGAVALSSTGAPAGVTVSFDQPSISGSGTAHLTVSASSSAAAGSYTITVAGASGSLSHAATYALTVTATRPPPQGVVFSDDAESGMGQWMTYSQHHNWTIEASSASHSGSHRFRSNAGRNYANNEASFLISKSFSLAGASGATLSFMYKFSTEDQFDFFYVWVSGDDGRTWSNVAEGSGLSQGWNHWAPQASIDLSHFAGRSKVRIAFSLQSDYSVTDWGVALDDIAVTAK